MKRTDMDLIVRKHLIKFAVETVKATYYAAYRKFD